jgi:hypothetical protein
MFKESIRLTMNLKFGNLQLIILKAFEELHVGDIVRLYYGKAKRINEGEKYPVLGFVLPLVNPTVVKRNRHVKVAIYGIEKVKSE